MALGAPHPRYLSQYLSSYEITEWLAYMTVEPFGQHRQDVMLAQIPATIANVNRDTKTRPEPFEVSDFLPRRQSGPTGPDPDLEAQIDRVFALMGGE